jgi:hypothetical protein
MKVVPVLALAALMMGCATIGSDVVPVGKDTYQMSMTGVGFATQANTNIKALKAANDYCSKIGKHMVPQHSSESGAYGWSPRQNSLVFMCVDENSPAYTQVILNGFRNRGWRAASAIATPSAAARAIGSILFFFAAMSGLLDPADS